jgi:hypothetical protein
MQLIPHTSLRADLGALYSIKKEKPLKAPPNDNMILDKKHMTLVYCVIKRSNWQPWKIPTSSLIKSTEHEFYDIWYLLLLPVKRILDPNSMDLAKTPLLDYASNRWAQRYFTRVFSASMIQQILDIVYSCWPSTFTNMESNSFMSSI